MGKYIPVFSQLLFESKSFRGALEGSIILYHYSVAVMRAVRSLIRNHRHFTATKTPAVRPHVPRSMQTAHVPTQSEYNTMFIFQRDSPLVVCFLTVCRESASVAVTATIRPSEYALFGRRLTGSAPEKLCSNHRSMSVTGFHLIQ